MANPNPDMSGLIPGHGRNKGSKNKKHTKKYINEQFIKACAEDNTAEAIRAFFVSVMNDPKVRTSERIKAAENVMKRLIVSADMDLLVENKPTVESAEEALAILHGLSHDQLDAEGLDGETS